MHSNTGNLRVLVVISAPVLGEEGYAPPSRPLNVWKEWRELTGVIKRGVSNIKPILMERLNPPTILELRKALAKGYDVLHFIGHGNKNGLFFEKESGRESFVSAEELMETLKGTSLKLIILNCCKSEGVAEKLIHAEANIRSILAINEEILDEEAFILSERIYSALLTGKTLAEAKEWVREAFRMKGFGESRAEMIQIIGDEKICFDLSPAIDAKDSFITLNEPPNNLRYDFLDDFVGRGEEMEKIYDKLEEGVRAIGITGIGGIGKSALATAAALKYSFLFPGGIVFVSAKDIENFTLDNVFLEMDKVLKTDILKQKPKDRESYAIAILNSKPHLLILDNLETTKKQTQKEIASFLGKIDSKRAGSVAIIASRSGDLAGISEIGINNIPIDSLKLYDSVYYLVETSGKEILPKIRGREEEIAELCHCHPFMLKLTLGALKNKPVERVIQELKNLEGKDLEEKTENWIGAMIKDLIAREKKALELLKVMTSFTGGAKEEAVVKISINSFSGNEREYLDALNNAAKSSLIMFDVRSERYDIHSLVSHYLNKSYTTKEEKEKIRLNHAEYYLKHAKQYKKGNEHKWRDYDIDWENIASAADFISDKFNEDYDIFKKLDKDKTKENKIINLTQEYALALSWVVYFRHLGKDGAKWLETGVKAFQLTGDKRNEALMCNNIGLIHYAQGNYPEALKWYNKGMEISEKIGDIAGLAATYNNIGGIHRAQGDYSEALKWFNKSAEISKKIGDTAGLPTTYNNIGGIHRAQGNYPEALKWFNKSVEISEKIGNTAGLATTYNNIGLIHKAQGNYPKALKWFNKSMEILEKIGDTAGLATTYNNIGSIHNAQGNYPEALKWFNKSVEIKEKIGDTAGLARTYNNIGEIQRAWGDYLEALKWYNKSIEILEKIGDTAGLAATYNNIGSIHDAQGNYPEALKWYNKSVEIMMSAGKFHDAAMVYSNMGYACYNNKDFNSALKYLTKSLELFKKLGPEKDAHKVEIFIKSISGKV